MHEAWKTERVPEAEAPDTRAIGSVCCGAA